MSQQLPGANPGAGFARFAPVEPWNIAELIERPLPTRQSYIEPAVLPYGGCLLFGGHSKTGKSFIMIELARAVSMGIAPFGSPGISVPEPVPILLIEQEIGEWGLQKRAKTIFAGEKLDLLRQNFRGVSKFPDFDFRQPGTVARIADMVHRARARVLFLDPISKMHTYDENSNTEIANLFSKLAELREACKDLKTALVMSHHFGKPIRDPRVVLTEEQEFSPYNFRGASKWYDDPDTLVTVNKRAPLDVRSWKHWCLKTHWETRQGGEVPEWMTLSVNRENDLRVRYVRTDVSPLSEVESDQGAGRRAPMSTAAGVKRL